MEAIEPAIGYTFKDKGILKLALTHPSHAQASEQPNEHYQRLEFLGDSVLSFILSEHLYSIFPNEREGALASYRAALVQGAFLAGMAKKLKIPEHLVLSEAEANCGGAEKDSILEDCLEALIAAIYLDSDIKTAKKTILAWYGDIASYLDELLSLQNPKGQLQEFVQKKDNEANIVYQVKSTEGPDHSKQYKVEVLLNGKVLGIGSGSSKKIAEEEAAREGLASLKKAD